VHERTTLCLVVSSAITLSVSLNGCNKLRRDDPAEARAEVKRQQAACGSASAGDRLKNSIFDQAIAERQGNRANLDVLADYSVARLQDPVVKGWDRSLDITHCEGRFILDVSPGAERGFAGEHELQADINYTAQASADGAGFVYHQRGAEPIVAKLAAFNLGIGAYRPPPAIDEPQAAPQVTEQGTVAVKEAPNESKGFSQRAQPAILPTPPKPPAQQVSSRVAEGTSTKSGPSASTQSGSTDRQATVRAFYDALGAGNGAAASSQVIPEKRLGGPYSSAAISRFYGHLREPLRVTGIVPLANGAYRVTYRYSAGRSRCKGNSVVKLTNRGGRDLIRSIQALSGC
jgi:hypothetical protein